MMHLEHEKVDNGSKSSYPSVVYKLGVPSPCNCTEKNNKNKFYIFWNSKMEKRNHEVVFKTKKGGKDFSDFHRFLLIKHCYCCLNAHFKNHLWSYFLRYNIVFYIHRYGWSLPYA